MAFIIEDRVRDTSTSTGAGPTGFAVSGTAPTRYRTLSAVLAVNDTFPYAIIHQTLNEWELGLGTYTSANTFTRTTIYSSSNADAAVNFSAGVKDVFMAFPGTPGVATTIELGHPTDTTLSRSAAGKLAVEGSNVITEAGTTAQNIPVGSLLASPSASGPSSGTGSFAYRANGGFGGGFALEDGTGNIGFWCDTSGTFLRIGFGTGGGALTAALNLSASSFTFNGNAILTALTGQALDATLTALAAYNTNGLVTQTAADTFVGRTITGTASRISISNGNGVGGNPTIDIDAAYVGQSTITTLGTITTGVWNGTRIANANIAQMAAATIKGRAFGAGTGDQTDLTPAQASAVINGNATGSGNTNYTILASDGFVFTNAAFTAARTWTLPAANAVTAGRGFYLADAQGTLTQLNTLTIARAGSDTIDGATSIILDEAYDYVQLVSDGVSKWKVVAFNQVTLAAANNLIINGGMEVDQVHVGASFSIPDNVGTYIADMFGYYKFGAGTMNGQQVADAPAGLKNSIKATVTAADTSLAGSDTYVFFTNIEGYRIAKLGWGAAGAIPISLAFWVKANRTGTYSGAIRNSAGNRAYPFNFTVSVSGTWEFKTVVIPGDTTGTWLTTNGVGLVVGWCMAAVSTELGTANTWAASNFWGVTGSINGVAATSDFMNITGVVLVPGSSPPTAAQAFSFVKPFDVELALCQRYYEKAQAYANLPNAVAGAETQNISPMPSAQYGVRIITFFRVSKRTVPTMTWYSTDTGASGKVSDGVVGDVNAVTANVSENSASFGATMTSAGTLINFKWAWQADARM
jgi:hypothetical protein